MQGLRRIPLQLRMLAYSVSFLALLLVGLPWAASRLDPLFGAWRFSVPDAVRVAAGVLQAGLLLVYIACSWWLTHWGRGAYVEFDPPTAFVSSGPFAWCRNPIAACVVALIGASALVWSSIGVLLLFLAAIPLAHAQVVLLEEPLLERRFGEAYRAYRRRVPRWAPCRPRGDGGP